MGRPLLFIDFDGVINQFPDDKVMRRQGRTDWMEPDDPRRDTYSPDNWFGPDGTSEWTLDDSDYGPEGSSDNQKGNR